MSGEPTATTEPPAPSDPVTVDVRGSVADYKSVGLALLGFFSALPAAGIASAIVRAPGESGVFDDDKLIAGIVCLVIAAAFGIGLLMWVRSPVTISAAEMNKVNLGDLPEVQAVSYEDLIRQIHQLAGAVANEHDQTKYARLTRNLQAAKDRLNDVKMAAAAVKLRQRMRSATLIGLIAGILVFAGGTGALLGLAPGPNAEELKVVKVGLNDDGVKKLGCPKAFTALQVGGSDDEPEVIPLGVTCTAGPYVTLSKAKKQPTATDISDVEAANP